MGLMSGTSADGVDAVLVDFSQRNIRLIGHVHRAYPPDLRAAIVRLFNPGDDGIDETFSTDAQIGKFFAGAALELLRHTATPAEAVIAIGSHGQTVRHRPGGSPPFTLQLGDANIIAEMTGITTVADFRRRDMASGGQGAPLVPAFHDAIFSATGVCRCILNIGGIANLTLLNPGAGATGFDCGPGNGLLDLWTERHTGNFFDSDGAWSRGGSVDTGLLDRMMRHPFFSQPAPKSTGKEMFNAAWLDSLIADTRLRPVDVARTLIELTAASVAMSIDGLEARPDELFVCGGGTYNGFMLERISHVTGLVPRSTAELGVHPQHVEAMAFAWMARQTVNGLTANLPAVTGASGPRILGAIHQR
jgi:anhydro-N-acetylmuramic acid kinase